jgi:hypothetical protein
MRWAGQRSHFTIVGGMKSEFWDGVVVVVVVLFIYLFFYFFLITFAVVFCRGVPWSTLCGLVKPGRLLCVSINC